MKAKKQTVVSPFSEAKFSYLNRPDTKFDQEKGKFSVHLVMDPEDQMHAAFLKKIEDIAKAAVGAGATIPVRDDKDRDGNLTGMKLVKFASLYRPKILDMAKKPLEAEVGSGSVIRVSALVNVYKGKGGKSGINLYLLAVQVKELVEPAGARAEDFGFEAETQIEPETKKEPMDLPF